MVDYESAIRTVIASGNYDLTALEDRIETLWVEGKMSAEVRAELIRLAAEGAQSDVAGLVEAVKALEARVLRLEDEQYAIWTPGYVTKQHEIVRFDVTGDGELDLCRYDGGRNETSLSIGKIEGWHLLNRELENVATITKNGTEYVITPIEPEAIEEPVDDGDSLNEDQTV